MTPAAHLIHECRRRGAILRRDGYALEIERPSYLPAGLIEELKARKPDILALLDSEAGATPPNETPLVHLATQVVSGEFVGASPAMLESVAVSLRASRHPLCARALRWCLAGSRTA